MSSDSSETNESPAAGAAGAANAAGAAAARPERATPEAATPRGHRRRVIGWRSRDVVRAAALVFGLYWLSRLFWLANPLFLTAFLGVLFGLAVSSGVDRIQRLVPRIPRGAAAGLIVLTFIGALVAFGFAVAPTLREQGGELQRKIPEAIDRVEHWLASKQGSPLGIVIDGIGKPTDTAVGEGTTTSQGSGNAGAASAPASGGQAASSGAPATAASGTNTPNPSTAAPTAPGVQVPNNPATGVANSGATTAPDTTQQKPAAQGQAGGSLRQRLSQQLGSITRYLFPFLHSTVAAFAGLLLIIFMAIYIAADPDLYHRGLISLFPKRHRPRVGDVFSNIAGVLRKWLVTQLIAMATIGAVTTIVLLILDVKAAFALGVIAGLLEFVPTVGPILSAVPAIAMAFLDSPEKALYVGLAYVGIQFIENHLLIPLLMKGGMDLPPALTILAQALMALLFGFLGLMCAVPMLAAGMVAVKMLYLERVIGERPFGPDEDPRKGTE